MVGLGFLVLGALQVLGANLGTPALSVPAMAATHGVADALGFGLLGVVGWRAGARRWLPARAPAAPRVVVRPSPLEEPSWSSPA